MSALKHRVNIVRASEMVALPGRLPGPLSVWRARSSFQLDIQNFEGFQVEMRHMQTNYLTMH
jgi:hypothetical protein